MNERSIKDLPIEAKLYIGQELRITGTLPSCANCAHNAVEARRSAVPGSREAPDLGCMVHRMIPPLYILVNGCLQWEQAVPF